MDVGLGILFVVALWWGSTVVLLYRTGLESATFTTTLVTVALLAVAGAVAIALTLEGTTRLSAYVAFTGALAVWALLEASYLLGYLTGVRSRACPADAGSGRRFWYGLKASLFHEVAIILAGCVLFVVTRDTANDTAFLAFASLWFLRWSVKLNIFLGARNLHAEFWPDHLAYLKSYAREAPMNAWFPMSIALAAVWLVVLLQGAAGAELGVAERTGRLLVACIVALGLLEHVLLMSKLPDAALWRLGTRSRQSVG